MLKASLLPRAVALAAALVSLAAPSARAAGAAARGERTPVDLSGGGSHAAHVGGGGGSIVRTIVGLAIVIGVIYGVAWVLRQVKAGREPKPTGAGLASLASVPLGSGRSLHLVRAGRDLALVGVAEHGVTPIRTYTEAEALAAGLIDEHGAPVLPDIDSEDAHAPRRARLPRFTLPAPAARPARRPLTAPGLLGTLRAWTVRE
jgi:flagellar protein FliO/FliZ